jgi:hypothetical protein
MRCIPEHDNLIDPFVYCTVHIVDDDMLRV